MSPTVIQNQGSSPVVSESIFEILSSRTKRIKTIGLALLISGFTLFFVIIILVATIGPFALIILIPMPFLIFFGFRYFYSITRSGAESAYKKVGNLLNSKDVSALKAMAILSLKDESNNNSPENYFQRLFSIAALIDLNDAASTNLAINLYKTLNSEKIRSDEIKIMLQALARKLGKTSFIELLS